MAVALVETIQDWVLRSAIRMTGQAHHRYARPCLMDLHRTALAAYQDPVALLRNHLPPPLRERALDGIIEEFVPLAATLRERYDRVPLAFPAAYALADEAAFVLYALARLLRPRTILESGVANGHSTYVLVHAVRANGCGRVHSVDVSPRVGALLRDEERVRWSLTLLRRGHEHSDLRALVASLPPIDLFHHDSLHTYAWQSFEFATVTRHSPAALIVSDDADGSFAFSDHCERTARRPIILVDERKVFGIVPRTGLTTF
ncbi:MAG TPA: class I SAM-dependent methyltransferase [Candidatus Acidoferrum sp.]|nr:class I SAM-dependent methyltransferase [Candidatus Acidoferrum sp.]